VNTVFFSLTAALNPTLLAATTVMLLLPRPKPLLSYALAPEETPHRIERLKSWLGRNGRRLGIRGATVIGVLLIIRAAIELLF
jgi:hypothetical protein